MRNKIIFILVTILVFISLLIGVLNFQSKNKIAFVRNAVVMEKYEAMKDAQKEYEELTSKYKSNIDTLRYDFQRQVNSYNAQYPKMTKEQQEQSGLVLQKQEQELKKYTQTIEQKMSEEDNRLMQGVLNQMNAYIKKYAEDNNYDFILGTTTEGNVMYSKDKHDITEKIIEGLNTEYQEGI